MHQIIYLIILFLFFSCTKENNDTIPSYIHVENINFDENTTHNITDVWIYINDNLQGIYELPALFPVLENGEQMVRIRAGIKSNGISSTRIPYPFYASYFHFTELLQDSIIIINPTITYSENNSFAFIEDFEGVGLDLSITNNSDTTIHTITNGSKHYGAGFLNDSIIDFEIATDEIKNLPKGGAPVFLELDYKSNTRFLAGVYINKPLEIERKDLVWITPKEDWNKIYINLTEIISESINSESHKIFLSMQRDFSLDTNRIYFDNLKVIY